MGFLLSELKCYKDPSHWIKVALLTFFMLDWLIYWLITCILCSLKEAQSIYQRLPRVKKADMAYPANSLMDFNCLKRVRVWGRPFTSLVTIVTIGWPSVDYIMDNYSTLSHSLSWLLHITSKLGALHRQYLLSTSTKSKTASSTLR